jgi:hypothetical protein
MCGGYGAIYGAERTQTPATGGKASGREKPHDYLQTAASSCIRLLPSRDGKEGVDGPKGDTGATGATGPKGDPGAQGPKGDSLI